MKFVDPPPYANRILAALPPSELALFRPHLTRTRVVINQTLHEPGERVDQVFFFDNGFASVVALADNIGTTVEVGLIGWDGMVGVGLALNPASIAFNRTMVQMSGIVHRMPAAVLTGSLSHTPVLRSLLLDMLEVMYAQVSQTAACNSRHTLAQRCARWLLLAHDRVDGDELYLTQEFLSVMLAVRRAGVTLAVQALQAAGLVQSGRGRIVVQDRAGLEAAACTCYARVCSFSDAVHAGRSPV
ncbi:MAG: Crp/Fnr family transcriptional regulator [Janthinobacterium lividum]